MCKECVEQGLDFMPMYGVFVWRGERWQSLDRWYCDENESTSYSDAACTAESYAASTLPQVGRPDPTFAVLRDHDSEVMMTCTGLYTTHRTSALMCEVENGAA